LKRQLKSNVSESAVLLSYYVMWKMAFRILQQKRISLAERVCT